MSLINTQEVEEILDIYDAVATGSTNGGGGCFYADGKGTLNGVIIPIHLLELLAIACGREVHPRTSDYRKTKGG